MLSYLTRPRGSRIRHAAASAAVIAGTLTFAGCRATDILQVTDPDIINPSDVQSAAGASAVRTGALARLNNATSGGSISPSNEGLFMLSGLFADEWINGDSFIARQEVDQRVITVENTFLTEVDRKQSVCSSSTSPPAPRRMSPRCTTSRRTSRTSSVSTTAMASCSATS
jgi:hypothetical protein